MFTRSQQTYRSPGAGPRLLCRPAPPTSPDGTREETIAFLRASWFMLEAMGLATLAPEGLQKAVDHSTVFGSGAELEPFV